MGDVVGGPRSAIPTAEEIQSRHERAGGAHPSRFVRLRCPLCDDTSPACDQSTDVRRDLLARWWDVHKRSKHPFPRPIIEATEPEGRCVATLGERPSWMSPDQYDPCRCVHPMGHEGEHGCEHTERAEGSHER